MSRALRRVVGLVLVALLPLATGCAGSSRPRPESSARLKDAAPEKIAAQRAAGRDLERDDERWGFEAARERRRAEDQKQAQKQQKADAATPTRGPAYILQTPVR